MTAGLMSRIDPRIGMAFGFGLQTVAGLWMLTFDLNVSMETCCSTAPCRASRSAASGCR
jgi:hypothetical protein